MRRKFNTTGKCDPQRYYMVNIEKRLEEIKVLIEEGAYFSINRARQYGKTTVLHEYPELKDMLYTILFTGIPINFNKDNHVIHMAAMFGFIKNTNGYIAIANRIFETRLYNLTIWIYMRQRKGGY